MRTLVSLVQFLLGFILALVILTGGSVAAALYFVTKLTALPPRPSFANDRPPVTATSAPQKPKKAASGGGQASGNSGGQLAPGTYRARVI